MGRSRLAFRTPLTIGDTVTRISTVRSVEHKSGKTGDLVFVTVRHEIAGPLARLAIEEEHDIVYRGLPAPDAPPPRLSPPRRGRAMALPHRAGPRVAVSLLALTFNSHRIHYDLDYVTREEGIRA